MQTEREHEAKITGRDESTGIVEEVIPDRNSGLAERISEPQIATVSGAGK